MRSAQEPSQSAEASSDFTNLWTVGTCPPVHQDTGHEGTRAHKLSIASQTVTAQSEQRLANGKDEQPSRRRARTSEFHQPIIASRRVLMPRAIAMPPHPARGAAPRSWRHLRDRFA
mmetsp:Transcript_79629/g.238592  ORF Transcript_79629/g.238592 Transcript_79629/m.238592 type:complete len:116 (+) Transcript_79629:147-494(+)|eukprot:4467807-Prymnesium_polylepis.1